ncbi:MAG: PadR family transcriptional regulator [Peptococcales bacterium]|jgi:DNA-binding PadR family transcriptional regulator
MNMDNNKIKSLTQPMYYILLSLKEKRHGYEIMQYVEWLTEGRVKIGPGTLYSLLSRFEEAGYIEMISDKDNKKVYLIKTLGEEILDGEIQRLRLLIKDAEMVQGGNEHEFQNRK